MFRPILIPAIAHGITDIVDAPKQSIITYSLVCPLVYHFPIEVKTALLVGASIYHLRQDMPSLKDNIMMHILWIQCPIIAELYLSFIHTPRHYSRTLKTKTKQKLISICMITITILFFKYIDQTFASLNLVSLWWVGPVLSHVYINDFYMPYS